MDQDNRSTRGAPSDDTTSALFVSARKKQLEQQEVERRAKEKEDKRLAAEAEVRRLEQEVEDRRRKAEEDSRKAEAEARRIAEEAREKQAQAAADPDSVLGAPARKREFKLPQIPKPALPKAKKADVAPLSASPAAVGIRDPKPAAVEASPTTAAAAKAPPNKKMLLIIGAAAALAVLALVLILALGGGRGGAGLTHDRFYYLNGDETQLSLYFFSGGQVDFDAPGMDTVVASYEVEGDTVTIPGHGWALRIIDENTLIDHEGDYFIVIG